MKKVNHIKCPFVGMVDMSVLEADAERCESSSLSEGTKADIV